MTKAQTYDVPTYVTEVFKKNKNSENFLQYYHYGLLWNAMDDVLLSETDKIIGGNMGYCLIPECPIEMFRGESFIQSINRARQVCPVSPINGLKFKECGMIWAPQWAEMIPIKAPFEILEQFASVVIQAFPDIAAASMDGQLFPVDMNPVHLPGLVYIARHAKESRHRKRFSSLVQSFVTLNS
jgi:hypothetical protein